MHGKTVVISGATSGIGEVAALELARQGARIVFIARDRSRAEQTLARLTATAPRNHGYQLADLSQLSEMKRVAAQIAADEPRIDVLLNNAGALFNSRRESADGLEMTFAVNHLAYFVLTQGLLARLEASGAARVVCTSSRAHEGARVNFDDLQTRRGYRGFRAYARSKLMNILFTRELARRLTAAGSIVTANCLHPGFVATRFGDVGNYGLLRVGLSFAKRFALHPEQGARTLIYLASSSEVAGVTGRYFHECRPARVSRFAESAADARRLWEISAQLADAASPAH